MNLFFERVSFNYVDVVSVFAIPMVIAIFALAFPLLFQTASRIDDKYNSTLLIKVFRKDWICKCFIYTLLSLLWIMGIAIAKAKVNRLWRSHKCSYWQLCIDIIACINRCSCCDDNMFNVADVCLLYAKAIVWKTKKAISQ